MTKDTWTRIRRLLSRAVKYLAGRLTYRPPARGDADRVGGHDGGDGRPFGQAQRLS
jgi:hypothetical protein